MQNISEIELLKENSASLDEKNVENESFGDVEEESKKRNLEASLITSSSGVITPRSRIQKAVEIARVSLFNKHHNFDMDVVLLREGMKSELDTTTIAVSKSATKWNGILVKVNDAALNSEFLPLVSKNWLTARYNSLKEIYDGLVVEQRPLKRAHIQSARSSSCIINQESRSDGNETESEPNPLVVQQEEEISPTFVKISCQDNKITE